MKFKLFGRTWEIKNATSGLPALSNDAAWTSYLAGHGYAVDALTALKVSAVFRCVDAISRSISALPLNLYEETDNGKAKARNELHRLLYIQPNRHTTSYELRQMLIANLLLTRGAFLKIERDGRGFITALWNIPTANCSEIQVNPLNGERYVYATIGGVTETLRDGDFVFIPNFRFTSDKTPLDPISIAADVLGLTKDLTKYASATFEQGVNPGGFIESPAGLSDTAYARVKEDFNKNYAGALNAGKFIILEEGSKANVFTRDMEKTQNLESRRFAVTEICRMFGVPPHIAYDLEHATFSNIEMMSAEYVRDCINPLCVKLEQAFYKDLLTDAEKRTYFFKFNTNAMMRGDTATRAQYYSVMRQNGIMNADEIRELEDMNHIEGGLGKVYLVNGNMVSIENAAKNVPKGAQNKA